MIRILVLALLPVLSFADNTQNPDGLIYDSGDGIINNQHSEISGGNVDYRPALEPGVLSPNLDLSIPAISYEGEEQDYNLWAELEYLGTDSEGRPLWRLKEYGENPQ